MTSQHFDWRKKGTTIEYSWTRLVSRADEAFKILCIKPDYRHNFSRL